MGQDLVGLGLIVLAGIFAVVALHEGDSTTNTSPITETFEGCLTIGFGTVAFFLLIAGVIAIGYPH